MLRCQPEYLSKVTALLNSPCHVVVGELLDV